MDRATVSFGGLTKLITREWNENANSVTADMKKGNLVINLGVCMK